MLALKLAQKAWKTALNALTLGQGLQAVLSNNASVSAGALDNQVAPAAVILAAFLVTPLRTGVFKVIVNYSFTDSAADTVSIGITAQATETAFSGGTLITPAGAPMALRTADAGAVTATASGGAQINAVASTTLGGAGPGVVNVTAVTQALPLGVPSIVLVKVTATHNLTAQTITASCSETA